MHPELFELKALVAGRLDAHRRREIDDHLGSCADCSRQYVALMLGSSSPKTAEAEAREALVPTGGSSLTLVGGGAQAMPMYGIDAPLKSTTVARPAAPRAPHQPPKHEPDAQPDASRGAKAGSSSLVDAITRLRAESAPPAVAAAPHVEEIDALALAPEIIAPTRDSSLIAPSIFTPTPSDGVSLIHPMATPESTLAQPAAELIVTFSSTPPRTPVQRSTPVVSFGTAEIVPSHEYLSQEYVSEEYVSQAIPTRTSAAPSHFELGAPSPTQSHAPSFAPSPAAVPTSAHASAPAAAPAAAPVAVPAPARAAKTAFVPRLTKPILLGSSLAAAAIVIAVALAGYQYFRSSVSAAAAAAAAAAAQQVEAAAARPPAGTRPAAAGPVQTRIVYVEKPSRKSQAAQARPETVTVTQNMPIAVTLPDVNLNTGTDASVQNSTQRSVTSELTRSARATAGRTATPRP